MDLVVADPEDAVAVGHDDVEGGEEGVELGGAQGGELAAGHRGVGGLERRETCKTI